jgi:hypothetical protein
MLLKADVPYKEWMDTGAESMRKIIPDKFPELEFFDDTKIKQYEKMFNVTYEEKGSNLKASLKTKSRSYRFYG